MIPMLVSDYNEGAAPEILEAFARTNMIQAQGYGADPFTASAKEKIRAAIECPEAQITFLYGGTQTNQLAIDTMLRPFDGVVAVEPGHVNTHEAGAIEYSGHKVLALPEHDGKMDAAELEAYVAGFWADGNHEHMVFPGMVYITHPTENGTLYTREEMTAIAEVCHKYDMPLYLDGARLGYGLAAAPEVDLPFIAKTVDAFYIGGTKVGALFGEALIFTKNNEPSYFMTRVKQHGGLLAKGRTLGVQFDTLFTDGLYFRLGQHAVDMGLKIRDILTEAGCRFFIESRTNQQFIIIENSKMEALAERIGYEFWEAYDEDHAVIRFCASWATTEETLESL
jgi:threonine aldolase